MQCNVGKIDRAVRIAAGLIVLSLGLYAQSWLGLIGLVPLMTGIIRWCPVYVPFGIKTG
jgi:hypothetical protein